MQTHLRRLHGFETFGEVDGTLLQLQLVRDPGELVGMDDGGLAGRRCLGRLGPKSAVVSPLKVSHEVAA